MSENAADERAPATILIDRLVSSVGRRCAHQVLDVILDKMSTVELAALAHDWRHFWARPKQIPPATAWRSIGHYGGRGSGKTRANGEFVNEEASSGRAMLIGLGAQNEDKSIDIQVHGRSGLIATAAPGSKPQWEASAGELVWPNGARAKVLTPEAPGAIRGYEFHLTWLTELQSWPVASREEAMLNFAFATRLGYARTVWDATPKRGHPVLRGLRERAAADSEHHLIIRAKMRENIANLGAGVVEELERRFGGTTQGREELDGEDIEDAENVIAQQSWIDDARRRLPDRFLRRGLGVDPAVTSRRSSDRTGIIEAALGVDGQGYVLDDLSGKHDAPTWGALVIDRYVASRCDVVVVETNKGGNLLSQNLRAIARDRGLEVVLLEKDRPPHAPGKIFVREIYSKGEKADRARPLSSAYELRQISHVIGANLASLEQTLTGWEPTPGARSPDDLDALTHVMVELLELKEVGPDLSRGFHGITKMSKAVRGSPAGPTNLAAAFGRGTGGRI